MQLEQCCLWLLCEQPDLLSHRHATLGLVNLGWYANPRQRLSFHTSAQVPRNVYVYVRNKQRVLQGRHTEGALVRAGCD
jgi:hypothetical protein